MIHQAPRLPDQIPEEAYDPKNEGRAFRLLSQKEINYVRKIQLAYRFENNHQKHFRGVLHKDEHEALDHTVIIGYANEAIALYDKPIGSGSFGKVYVGVSCDTGEFCAVKMQKIRSRQDANDVRYEIDVLSEFDRLIDNVTIDDGIDMRSYLAQPFEFGKDCFHTIFDISDVEDISKKPMDLYEKVKMALEISKEIERFHNKGWLHCDLKLLNVMWDPLKQTARLIDFGTSRKMNREHVHVGPISGTELYMAPEYLRNIEDNTRFSIPGEIYALGITLLQIFSDRKFDKHPRAITLDYISNRKDSGISDYIEYMGQDIFEEKSKNKHMRSIKHLLKSMVDINPQKRPSMAIIVKCLQSIEQKLNPERLVKPPKVSRQNSSRCLVMGFEQQRLNVQKDLKALSLNDVSEFKPRPVPR